MMRADNTETGDEDASGRRSSTGSQDSEEADMPHEDGATKGSLKTSSDNEKHLSASERKRNREKQRRNKLNQGLDELASLLYKIDPSLQTYSEAPPSHLSSSQGGWPMDFPPKDGSQTITNRVELINCALKMLKQLHRENEQRKKFLEDLAKAGLISLAHIDAALSNKPTMPAPASASVLLNQQQQDSPLIGGSFPTAAANSFVVPGAPRGGIQTTQRGAVPPPPPTSGIIRSQSGGPEEEMGSDSTTRPSLLERRLEGEPRGLAGMDAGSSVRQGRLLLNQQLAQTGAGGQQAALLSLLQSHPGFMGVPGATGADPQTTAARTGTTAAMMWPSLGPAERGRLLAAGGQSLMPSTGSLESPSLLHQLNLTQAATGRRPASQSPFLSDHAAGGAGIVSDDSLSHGVARSMAVAAATEESVSQSSPASNALPQPSLDQSSAVARASHAFLDSPGTVPLPNTGAGTFFLDNPLLKKQQDALSLRKRALTAAMSGGDEFQMDRAGLGAILEAQGRGRGSVAMGGVPDTQLQTAKKAKLSAPSPLGKDSPPHTG